MDLDREEQRSRYRLCRIAFSCIAIGLALLCLSESMVVAWLLTGEQAIRQTFRSPAFDWLVSSPVTWFTVLGAYLLWGRWTDPAWQRRAGLLLGMNLLDLGYWALKHASALGYLPGQLGDDWLLGQVPEAIGWLEFVLFAGLAADLSAHLGKEDAPESGRAAQAIALLGFAFWAVCFLSQTHWRSGWPLRPRPFRRVDLLLWLGSRLLTIAASFQVILLSAAAARLASRTVAEMDRDDQEVHLEPTKTELFFGDERDAWFSDTRDRGRY
jgi:hypothetical protein